MAHRLKANTWALGMGKGLGERCWDEAEGADTEPRGWGRHSVFSSRATFICKQDYSFPYLS